MRRLYLVRHAESEKNAQNTGEIGQTPHVPLSQRGIDQAELLGEYLAEKYGKFDHVFCSPYKRTRQTLDLVKKYIKLPDTVFDERLREYSAGDALGKFIPDIFTPEMIYKQKVMTTAFKFPNGESLLEVEQRAVEWLYDQVLKPRLDGDILVVSHGYWIRMMANHLLQLKPSFLMELHIKNTAISVLEYISAEQVNVVCFNRQPHLGELYDD